MSEISDLMTTKLVTVDKKTPLVDAIDMIVKYNITGIPVVDKKNRLEGIISEKDMLCLSFRLQNKEYDSNDSSLTVGDVMTTEVTSFDKNDSLGDVCKCLMTSSFRRVPITSGGILVGLISRKDLLTLSAIPA
jgi:CBS domain-containing protein